MIDEKKLLTIAVIVSLICTASLYLYSANQDADRIDISDIDENMLGSQVETSGFISNIMSLEDRHIIELKEKGGNSSITAFVDNRVLSYLDEIEEVRAGAEVFARGRIDIYEGEINMMVSRAGDFRVTTTAYSSFTRLSELMDNPEWHRGMDHKVRGEVNSIKTMGNDTILEIEPLEGKSCFLMIRVKDWDFTESYSVARNSVIVVKGTLEYDSFRGRWCITSEDAPEVH
ncbi:MAG: hypothetical protein ACOC53_05220 [Candidatus Saliniplasma sp.]